MILHRRPNWSIMKGVGQAPVQRWFDVGSSTAEQAFQAGLEAAQTAQAGRHASLLVVFCSALYEAGEVLEGICSVAPDDAIVVGATSMGELASCGTSAAVGVQPSVVIAALGGPGFVVRSKVVRQASDNRRDAGTSAAAVMDGVVAEHKAMLMIIDGLTPERHELVRGAYSVLGATVPIVGGCSADSLTYSMTRQFHGTGKGVELLVDSVVSVGLGSNSPLGVGLDHGWEKHGEPMVVTSSEEGEVFLIDNEPALDVYLRCVGADRSLLEDKAKYREVAFDHPFGLSRGNGEDLRVLYSADPERGSVSCLADVPQGALVWTMTADTESLIAAAGRSCAMAIESLNGAEPIGLLVFDCGARKVKLGPEDLAAEQSAIALAAGVPFAGFYTYGEIARTKGSRGSHHLSVASLAIS